MCGFAGLLTPAPLPTDRLEHRASAMASRLAHRGPDDASVWADGPAGIGLAHRRLAVLELSPAGRQPMHSASGNLVLAFNGEIYNHAELRAELAGGAGAAPAWRGHSDTETLLAGFERWGVQATLRRAVGMFALALWDRRTRTLTLARDRFGEKPLHYGWVGGAFVFGSELKALRAHPGFDNPVCRAALADYLRFGCVPAPRTIHQGVFKLEPGCLLAVQGRAPERTPVLPPRAPSVVGTLDLSRWWSLADAVVAGARAPLRDETEALDELEARLSDAVRLQSLADVPLGAFLSGGVDSSAVVALMQRQAARPVRSFTVGFEESGFDESPHARAVARHLGTEHHEIFVTAAQARELIPRLPAIWDEPFADSSQIPTLLVCQAARRELTVALSGDAGDEVFGGYNRYLWGPRLWRCLRLLPYPLRQALARALRAGSPAAWDRLLGHAGVLRPGEKLHKLAHALRGARSVDDLYANLVGDADWAARLVRGAPAADPGAASAGPAAAFGPVAPGHAAALAALDDPRARMMFLDTLGYLPDDILCKVDRAAMSVGLETRAPFLDHRVVELAWRLPMSMKIRDGTGKWALRQLLYRHVPRELIERPKAGFAIPVGQWLRGPLREWAEGLLSESRLRSEGYLEPGPVREAWQQHLGGRYDWTARLWGVLMFQAWVEGETER